MEESEESSGGSSRLRLFLIATRLAGVVLGLALTGMHSDAPNLPPVLKPNINLLTAAVLCYQILGCVLTQVARGALAPSLLLGFPLPVLEAACFFSVLAGIFMAVIGGVFFGGLLAFPLLSKLRDATDPLVARHSLQLIGVEGTFSLILLYLCNLALGENRQRLQFIEEVAQQKELLYQEMHKKTQDIGKIYAEVGEVVPELEKKLKAAEQKARAEEMARLEVEDQLIQAVEDLDKMKLASQHLEHAGGQRQGEQYGS